MIYFIAIQTSDNEQTVSFTAFKVFTKKFTNYFFQQICRSVRFTAGQLFLMILNGQLT